LAEIFDSIGSMLRDSIIIRSDEKNLTLSLIFKKNVISKDDLGEEVEIKDMLRIFGGLREDISMEIDIDMESQKIELKFQKKEDMVKVNDVLDNLWDNTLKLARKAFSGDFSVIRDLGDFND
jgi:hypothetical protein